MIFVVMDVLTTQKPIGIGKAFLSFVRTILTKIESSKLDDTVAKHKAGIR